MESATAETKKNTENFNCDRRTDDDRCQEISLAILKIVLNLPRFDAKDKCSG